MKLDTRLQVQVALEIQNSNGSILVPEVCTVHSAIVAQMPDGWMQAAPYININTQLLLAINNNNKRNQFIRHVVILSVDNHFVESHPQII